MVWFVLFSFSSLSLDIVTIGGAHSRERSFKNMYFRGDVLSRGALFRGEMLFGGNTAVIS